jgi:hypothetical protein
MPFAWHGRTYTLCDLVTAHVRQVNVHEAGVIRHITGRRYNRLQRIGSL